MNVYDKNFNVAIFWDIVNMINVKLCMMVVLTELYSYIPISMTLFTSSPQQCQAVLTENSVKIFLSDEVDSLWDCPLCQVDHKHTTIFFVFCFFAHVQGR